MIKTRLKEIGHRLSESLARRVFELSQKYVPVRSGNLKNSGRVRKSGNAWEVVYGGRRAPYAGIVNRGRDGGTETVSAHTRKGYRRRFRGRSIIVRKHQVRSFKRKTKAREGSHFLDRAYEQTMAHEAKAELHQAARDAARK